MAKLADDETYLKKYENLSQDERQAVDSARRKRLKDAKAEAEAGDSFTQRAGDAFGRVFRGAAELTGSSSAKTAQQEAESAKAKREADRQQRLKDAQEQITNPNPRARYGSKTPGKIDDNLMPFKKGGKVSSASKRADGIASKGKTRGRMI